MAVTQESTGTVFQAWFPHPLDERLRDLSRAERRSLSQTIRIAVEDRLQSSLTTTGENAAGGGQPSPVAGAARKESA